MTLRVSKEVLTELSSDELLSVYAGAPPTLQPGCALFTDVFQCPQTRSYCPPPPAPDA